MTKVRHGLILTPGSGADSSSSALLAIESAVESRVRVRRMDFPYRKKGRKTPDRPPVLIQAVADELAAFTSDETLVPSKVFLGGRSMGGRICTMLAATGQHCAGLVLVSYPLHPPGKPDRLRVEHFGQIDVPCLFVSGTRDAFGSPSELMSHTRNIKGDVTHCWIDNGDHGLRNKDAEVSDMVRSWIFGRIK